MSARPLVVAAFALVTGCPRDAPPRAPQADAGEDRDPVAVVPGERLGPLHLGSNRAAVGHLGLQVRLTPGEPTMQVGRYLARFGTSGQLEEAELALRDAPRGADLAGQLVPRDATLDALVSLVPGCTPPQRSQRGAEVHCAANGLLVREDASGVHLVVRLVARRGGAVTLP